jgi:uncharacterized phage protein (TIGR01671 family)
MREILFKGKRKDNGEWIEGCCIKRWTGKSYKYYIHDGLYGGEVIPETVGQFTGLYDKHRKKIFEGDIAKPKRKDDDDDMWIFSNFVVVFDDGSWHLDNCGRGDFLYNFEPREIEIVGNRYDNPELLSNRAKGAKG